MYYTARQLNFYRNIDPEEWGEFLHLPGVKFTDFNEIREEIVRDTNAKTGSNAGIFAYDVFHMELIAHRNLSPAHQFAYLFSQCSHIDTRGFAWIDQGLLPLFRYYFLRPCHLPGFSITLGSMSSWDPILLGIPISLGIPIPRGIPICLP